MCTVKFVIKNSQAFPYLFNTVLFLIQGHDGYKVSSAAEQRAVKAQNFNSLKNVLLADFLHHEHQLAVKSEELRGRESSRTS